jgi:hypothetical protein
MKTSINWAAVVANNMVTPMYYKIVDEDPYKTQWMIDPGRTSYDGWI